MKLKTVHTLIASSALSVALFGFSHLDQIAKENSIVVGSVKYEVDGVCKITDSASLCWKPNGSPYPVLTARIDAAVQQFAQRPGQSYSLTYLKKRRILIMKISQLSLNYSGQGNGSVYRTQSGVGNVNEGWNESNSNFRASERGFDGSQIDWISLSGTFELGTKEYPLQYEFPSAENKAAKGTVRDLTPGEFSVDGNVFEIVSIGDHKVNPLDGLAINSRRSNGDWPEPPKVLTDVTIRPISIVNPYSTMSLQLADENGNSIQYVDVSENSVSVAEYQKWENSRAGSGTNALRPASPYRAAGYFSFDPKYYRAQIPQPMTANFTISKEKCKRILITSRKRDVYTFEHIRLDPN